MKKAIVTGGGGFVGSAVVRQLIEEGIETAVVGRSNYPEIEKLGATLFRGDIRNQTFLTDSFEGYDTVFHVASKTNSWGSKEDYHSTNVTGTGNVITACRANNIDTLVYTSSPSVVFNGTNDICGVNERTPYAAKFHCHYAYTKMLAEKMVLAENSDKLKVTALRPQLVWGPGDVNLILALVKKGRARHLKQIGDGRNLVDISYIDNVAQAHILAARSLKNSNTADGKAYFISQEEPVNFWNWINNFFRRLDIPIVDKSIGYRRAYLTGLFLEITHSLFNIDKAPAITRSLACQLAKSHWFSSENAVRDLGYSPKISTAEGLNRMVTWVKSLPQ